LCTEEAQRLIDINQEIQEDIKRIVESAKNEQTQWDNIVKIFNDRFRNLPYVIDIKDRDSALLEDATEPVMILKYKHPTDPTKDQSFEKNPKGEYAVSSYLSTGERKAFYLLNVLFELNIRQQSGENHLIVLDDIVDSFDYKNKYAFLEYIHEIANEFHNLRIILLTHNFDFFRLLKSRLRTDADHFLIATKQAGEVSLEAANCFEIFGYMRKRAHEDKKVWVATLPFVRNLLEFKTDDPRDNTTDFMKLTKCLHSLDDDQDIATIQSIISTELTSVASHPFNDGAERVVDVLLDTANNIIDDGSFNIYDNIILAMACRRLAEDYMKSKMNTTDISNAKNDNKPFTMALFVRYKNNVADTEENKAIIGKVNLITPEHIHLNAFAYEPLIDIGKHDLIKLQDSITRIYAVTNTSP
jgi:hypothetical protein